MPQRFDLFAPLRAKARTAPTRAVGIDLGTTNSAVSIATLAPDGTIAVECLRDGQPDDPAAPVAIPTVVAITDQGQLHGRDARRLLRERVESARNKSVFAETKNEIGLRYSYWKAPPELGDATAVASTFLAALGRQFAPRLQGVHAPLVVGVPAAFHGPQRSATLVAASHFVEAIHRAVGAGAPPTAAAARPFLEHPAGSAAPMAGAPVPTRSAHAAPPTLIDEPVAAFLELAHAGALDDLDLASPKRILVFDFGGGTCDIALFDLLRANGEPSVILRGTSRYHRLGGGDIDRAIVHEVLLPQLLHQNKLHTLDLSWRQKKHEVEARLLPTAETLKHALCRKIAQARALGREVPADAEALDAQQHRLVVDGRTLWLEGATMTVADLGRVLEPFLDDAVRIATPNEYFSAVSIFEPIANLVERLAIDRASVDAVLFAGGSSLIPPVRDAVLEYFPNAKPLGGTDPERVQGAVARGAALQALSLALTGTPLIRPVSGIDVGIRTVDGIVDLVEEGATLPSVARRTTLAAPEDSEEPLEISIELVGARERVLFRHAWTLPAPVRAGEPLDLVIAMDENQAIELRLVRRMGEAAELHRTIGCPLSHTDSSHKVLMRVLEREERIRRAEIDDADRGVEFRRLAEDYGELRQYEKAIDAMRTALRAGEDAICAMTMIGNWYGRLQDRARAEQCYLRAIEVEAQSMPLFNLAMSRRDSGDLVDAMICADRAIEIGPDEPCHVLLKADLLRRLGRVEEADDILRTVASERPSATSLNDWQLGWFEWAAATANDTAWQAKLKAERDRRRTKSLPTGVGLLPALYRSP